MKTVCKIPLGHMREITDGLRLYVFSNEVLLFVHGPFGDSRACLPTERVTGLGPRGFVFPPPEGQHGIHVISCLELPGEK